MSKQNSLSNFNAARQFVEFGYQQHALGERESISGPGSSLDVAEPALWFLDTVIEAFQIKSILDLGCGDWNWLRSAKFVRSRESEPGVHYTGWDAHQGLIDQLNSKYSSDYISFEYKDICEDNFPEVDMILARDVLFHLNEQNILSIINRAQKSARYFAANCFNQYTSSYQPKEYLPIKGWSFGLLNLNISPFNLEEKLVYSLEEPKANKEGWRRFLNLYAC